MTPNQLRWVGDARLGSWPPRATRRRSRCSVVPRRRSAAASGICSGEFGENPATFECQIAARQRRPRPQSPSPFADPGCPRREVRSEPAFRGAALRRSASAETKMTCPSVYAGWPAGASATSTDRPATKVARKPEPVGSGPAKSRSRLGQDGVDEFTEGADDVGIVGEHLDDGRRGRRCAGSVLRPRGRRRESACGSRTPRAAVSHPGFGWRRRA